MTVSIEGIYRNGKIELAEVPSDVSDQTRVVVTLTRCKIPPVLVVRADTLHTGLPHVIVAMITSKLFRANHPNRVGVSLSTQEGRRLGLQTVSVVMTDNRATDIGTHIKGNIGSLPLPQIDKPLRQTFGL